MRLIIFLSTIIFILTGSQFVNAQSPDWLWASQPLGPASDDAVGIVSDAGGDLYIAGTFTSSTISFGSIILNGAGLMDTYIAKYDTEGNVIWAQSAGGTNGDHGTGIATDHNGHICVTGYFLSPSISFGSINLPNAVIPSTYANMFVVKYDTSGNALWARSAGGIGIAEGLAVATDAAGNVYATGRFNNDSLSFGITTLVNDSLYDAFVVKYDASGNVKWAKSAGSRNIDVGNSIYADNLGNVYVTGSFYGDSISFGAFTLINASAAVRADIFIVKYDSIGNVLWAKSAGMTGDDFGKALYVDAHANVYVTGSFTGNTLIFGTTILTGSGLSDMFLVKYDTNGNLVWCRSEGGTNSESGNAVQADSAGNVVVTGSYSSSSFVFGTKTLTNSGFGDAFVFKYDSTGKPLWAQSAGGTSNADISKGITIDAAGGVYIVGGFFSTSMSFGIDTLTRTGSADSFYAKMGSCYAFYSLFPDTIPHNWYAINYSSGALPVSYTWDWGDSSTATGATPTHTYNDSGYYNICIYMTDNNGCSNTFCDSSTFFNRPSTGSTMIVVNVIDSTLALATKVKNMEKSISMIVYPNPATTELKIITGSNKMEWLEIFDLLGKKIVSLQVRPGNQEINIDVSKIPNGIYLCRLRTQNGSETTVRFIKN